jgi:hypothetical protein
MEGGRSDKVLDSSNGNDHCEFWCSSVTIRATTGLTV